MDEYPTRQPGLRKRLRARLKERYGPQYRHVRYVMSRYQPQRIANTVRWMAGVVRTVRARRRETRLTVAVDICSFWEPLTGIGWYLYRLLESLAERDDVRVRLYGPYLPYGEGYPPPLVEVPTGPAVEWVHYPAPDDLTLPPWRLRQPVHLFRRQLLAGDGNRVLFAPNYLLPAYLARLPGVVVAMVHDLGFHKIPWTLEEGTLGALQERMRQTFARADHVITPSEAVRAELIEAGFAPAERVTAVHHGPGQLAAVPPGELPPGVPAQYALHVGTLEPRKNLGVLLAAWKQLVEAGAQPPTLVLAGRRGWKSADLDAVLEEGSAQGWLLHLGYLDNAQLAALYRGARLVLFPTIYEGFGLPAVEAQQAGAPLLCSDVPVLREVAGQGAHYAPPEDAEAWAREIRRLLESADLRQRLTEAGRTNAERFSWQKAADETVAVWQKAATSAKP